MPSQKYLHINGSACDYSEAHPVNISFTTSSPAQSDFYLARLYTDTLPVVGQYVQWYRRDNTLAFAGVISKVEPMEMWEGGDHMYVHISAVGYDDRLFRRSTWNRGALAASEPARCAQYRSYAGKVNTTNVAHSIVTWVSNVVSGVETSNRFGPELAGKTITVSGTNRVVLTVDTPEQLTLSSNAGALTSVDYMFTIYCGDVVRDLLDGNAYPHGLLGGGYAEFEGFTWTGTSVQQGVAISNKGLLFDPPVTIHDAIQTLLDANPDFYFAVDVNQVAYFAARTLVAAPQDFTATSGAQKRGIAVSITAEDVRNVEISITNYANIDPITDSFVGDGVTRAWFMSKPLHDVTDVSVNGVSVTHAEGYGTSVAKFYYVTASQDFWQDHGDPVLTGADTVTITYRALFADLIEYEDSAARAARATIEGSGFGRYEKIVDRTNFGGKADALADATASVTRLENNYYSININTFELGFQVGQSFIADVAQLQLSLLGLFIDEVTATDAGCKGTIYDFEYTLKCISISRRITELQVLRDAFSGGNSGGSTSSGGVSGGGGGSITTNTAYVTDITISGTTTISQPAVPVTGNAWLVIVRQDGTGGWPVLWGTGVMLGPVIGGGSVIGDSNDAAGSMCVITYIASGGKWYVAGTPLLGVLSV